MSSRPHRVRDPLVLGSASFQDPMPGYLALPTSGEGPAVMLLAPAYFPENERRAICDRLAREGFIAWARGEEGSALPIELQPDVTSDPDRRLGHLMRAVERVAGEPGVVGEGIGVIGIGECGSDAMLLAELKPTRVRAVVTFYGLEPAVHFESTRAAYLGHFVQDDGGLDDEAVTAVESAIRAGGREAIFHRYPGTHRGFVNPTGPAFDPTATAEAWNRSVEFLRERLAPG